jgi:hypothetical protein
MDINKIVPDKNIGEFFDTIELANDKNRSTGDRAEASSKINKVMGAFMKRPAVRGREIAKSHMATSDIPVTVTDNAEIFRNVSNFDMAWEQAFANVSLEPGRRFWEIEDMTSGLTFRKVAEGGRIKVEGLAASLAIVHVAKYGGAIGWTSEMISGRRFPIMEQKAMYFRDQLASDKANRHYQLLSTAATNTTAYNATASTERGKDIATINTAALAMVDRLKDGYVGDPLGNEILVLINPAMWSRIAAATRETSQDVAGQPTLVPFNIRYALTLNDNLTNPAGGSTSTDALFVMSGFKNQKATLREPTSFFDYDLLTDTYVQAVWTDYGAAAEASQIQKVAFA